MMLQSVLLAAYAVLTLLLTYFGLSAIRSNRPALTVFLGFCFFYLSLRGLMLLSGTYGIFGILHGGTNFDSLSIAKVLGLSVLFISAAMIGYGRIVSIRFEPARLRVMPNSYWHTAFVIVWSICAVALLFAEAWRNLNWVFPFVMLGALYFTLYRPRYYPRLFTIAAGLTAVVFALASTVERRDWAIAAASISLIVIISQSSRAFRLASLSLAMIAVIAFSAIMLRTGPTLSVIDTLDRLSSDALLPIIEIELDFPLVYDDLVVMADEVPRSTEFTYGKHFFKPLFSWISRDLWPAKPDSISRYYAETMNPQFYARGGSEPATFVGELYWNFSVFGAVFALMLGRIIRRIDDYWVSAQDLLQMVNGIVLATMIFYLLRGPIDTFWLAFAFYFSAWFGVSTLADVCHHAGAARRRSKPV